MPVSPVDESNAPSGTPATPDDRIEAAATIIGKAWYNGGGYYQAGAPSWRFMARCLNAAGLLSAPVSDEALWSFAYLVRQCPELVDQGAPALRRALDGFVKVLPA
jgi:hypothetical protein